MTQLDWSDMTFHNTQYNQKANQQDFERDFTKIILVTDDFAKIYNFDVSYINYTAQSSVEIMYLRTPRILVE